MWPQDLLRHVKTHCKMRWHCEYCDYTTNEIRQHRQTHLELRNTYVEKTARNIQTRHFKDTDTRKGSIQRTETTDLILFYGFIKHVYSFY